MANPFEKFLGPEDRLHKAVTDYLKLQYKMAVVAHPVNEGRRSRFEQFKIKWLGIPTGLPDLLIFTPRGPYHGLAIEIKAKGNKPTVLQEWWLHALQQCGWKTYWSNDFDAIKKQIDDYFRVLR